VKLLLDENLSDRIIYLRIGNSPTSKIVQILRDNFGIISQFGGSEVESILVLA
jgi:predicted nuclease of predicted toxin-antitoxin system